MSFYRKIKYFLVHTLMLSNKEAQHLIDAGKVEINGEAIFENCLLQDQSEIKVKGNIVRGSEKFVYLRFYKPVGFESSLNEGVKNNLSPFFKDYKKLAIAGRLDKQSEGLLLLSNDGKWVEKICHPNFEKEKEYEVILDKAVDDHLMDAFIKGTSIGGQWTLPAICERIEPNKIKVVLREGKNRQIRRVCHQKGFMVLNLKRLRIDTIHLNLLKEGEFASFEI